MTILLATPSFLLKMAPVRYRSADGCGAKIIGLNTGVEHKIVEGKSYYAFAKNPNGTYKTTESDVTTFGVMATFVTSADVAD